MLSTYVWTAQTNSTCVTSIDMELFLHYSLIPSFFIIMVLSFLQRRVHHKRLDDKSYLLGNRFGIVIPLDFIGTFNNRWSYGIAFGATANKVMFLFSEGYQPLQVPQWAQAVVLLIGGIEVGLSHFPFFACLSSDFRLISSILGFMYSLIWFAITIVHIVQCPHGQLIGAYETVIFYWPSLLCLAFLLGRFVFMFVKALKIHLGLEVQNEERSFLEVHQAEHVKQLMRKPPEQEAEKSWFQRKIYEWDPYFQFPSRMIGATVLAFICLYLFIIIEFCIYTYIVQELDVFEGGLESYVASVNETGVLTPAILRIKELITVAKDVWMLTIFSASLTCISYLFHILACYRKHIKRLWLGEKSFIPLKFHSPSSSNSVVAIARYSGWQIAYILWGYLIIHVVQCLFGVMIMYGLVLPVIHNQGLEMLKGLGIGILTISIVVGLMILQLKIAARFFLQPKIKPGDKQKPLALNNRKAFHNFNYFLFFYNVLLGLGACLFRLFVSCILGTWLIARIDRTIMQNGYEAADMGFQAWIGMLFVDHYHTNPVLVGFCHILLMRNNERKLQKSTPYWHLNHSSASSEPVSQERISGPQEKPPLSKEIIFDKAQPSKETDSLMNASGNDSIMEDATSITAVSTRSESEEKILSEIQEEKQTLEELKVTMDTCLPISQDMANIQESSEEDGDYLRNKSSREEGYFTSLGSLPSNLQPQAYKHALENIRGAKNNIRKLLYQLYEAIELTYQSKQGSEDRQNYHKALFELWINWNRSQSENMDDDDTQLLEIRTLDMSNNITQKLQLAFMDLMPKVQGLPSSLQDKLQQACYDMQELHTTFSLSNGFEDLDKHHLTQSKFKLTQAQGSIEELFCFLEDSIPSG
ncbi:stimulated by retinoic acid gene 6 protein-like isoform X1 [Phascolarctos cinereus]|uniref:Stimulated by retinoic acid gene 6 protein-like isoform X2 n=1 Tax=Phascolarctos cinereus TaxID=38626 RepID=A0A6P5LSJ7_PHACI|nr:stimulated by retinoic acid gene 6 protein-like isoform X2 [Phascolarctos cinereus]